MQYTWQLGLMLHLLYMHACMLSYIVVRAINCKICFESISIELTPRLVSEAFYNGEVEAELRTLASEMKLPIEESVFRILIQTENRL